MSTLYEQWQPSVGDRVRVVMRDETGATIKSGRTGTIVGVHPGDPHALCEVEYDSRPDGGGQPERQSHTASELQPIEEPARRVVQSGPERGGPPAGPGPAWQPTVGDRVMVSPGHRAGTISAVEERGGAITCEVEYDHHPGEPERPQRRWHPLRELTPLTEPSAAVLENEGPPSR